MRSICILWLSVTQFISSTDVSPVTIPSASPNPALERSESPSSKRPRLSLKSDSRRFRRKRTKSSQSLRSVRNADNSSRSDASVGQIGLVGISNMGNTCYLSSILQMTSHLHSLTEFVSSVVPRLNFTTEALPDNLRPYHDLLFAYMDIIDGMWTPQSEPIVPEDLFSALQGVTGGAKYEIGVQQDAEEVLSDLINSLNDGFNAMVPTIPSDSFVNLFKVHFINQNKCTVCSSIVPHRESSIILWLSLFKSSRIVSLEELLRLSYTSEQVIEDVACDSCHVRHNAVSQTIIVDPLPAFLLIGLKRFEWSKETTCRRKVSTKVSIPSNLSLTTNGLYELSGLILHHGTRMYSGHYTAQFFNDKSWINANDDQLEILPNIVEQQSQDAYIIAYKRVY